MDHSDTAPMEAPKDGPSTAEMLRRLPPSLGRPAVPHHLSFTAVVNVIAQAYKTRFDEALRHSQENTLAMRRDTMIFRALRARQMPVSGLSWSIDGYDKTNTKESDAAARLTRDIEAIPRFQSMRMSLLEAVFFGRYAVQLIPKWTHTPDGWRLRIQDHLPVNGDKLVFKWDGRVGIAVHAGLYRGSTELTDRGKVHFLEPWERQAVIIHRHEPEDADFSEPDLAGGIAGVGLRSRIYYYWWLKSQTLAWLLEHLERVGAGGFTIYYYEHGNPQSLNEVQEAAEKQWRNNAILFPRYREGGGGPGVERLDVNTAGSIIQERVSEYFDTAIVTAILGQTLSSSAGVPGLGTGPEALHEDTFSRIVKYDAINLDETLTTDLLAVLAEYNEPGVRVNWRFKSDVDKPNSREFMEAVSWYYEMGGSIDSAHVRSVLGLPEPVPGNQILAKVPPMAPAAQGMPPGGVPVVGPTGPGEEVG